MSIRFLVLASALSFLFLNSCNYDKLNPNFEEIGICFETDILPIFVSNCTSSGCHNSEDRKEGLDHTYYGGIIKDIKPYNPNKSKLLEYMKDRGEDQMPPLPLEPVSAQNISLIEEWINKGAPNTSNCEIVSCDSTSNVSFSFDVQPIMELYCNGCHSGPTAIGGYDLTNFNGVKITVNNGTLLGSIKYDSGYQTMPQNGGKLSKCRIKTIQTWIDEGAKDN